ncbi:hypothetical protein BRADI_5g19542v3 [Brachypodium distachyon]|uniref:Uncharacterized protein n=1 Tax=Brachypodium distachyon TaxID=15368 RepID=A0A2K2CI64_BRADI|nr:hypothetical protein BRADI_5g19542v3 [Brachypodium distachyon]
MASVLQCAVASFPQVYLGLPLSPYKIHSAAFAPLIDKCSSYLAGCVQSYSPKKHIITNDACPRCNQAPETKEHFFFQCQSSQAVWTQPGLPSPSSSDVPWTSNPPDAAVCALLWPAMVFTVLWKIWDSRNSVVFRHIFLPPIVIIRNILEDFTLWSHRLRNADSKIAATIWRDYLSSRLTIHVT